MKRLAFLVVLVVLIGVGCSRSDTSNSAGAQAGEAPGNDYVVRTPEVTVRSGEASSVRFSLSAKTPWKVNKEYPTKFLVMKSERQSGGKTDARLSLSRQTFHKDDFQWSGSDLELKIPMQASGVGVHDLRGKLLFSLCTTEKCVLKSHVMAWRVNIVN
jgi:hypothetical protein